ncbi:MAG TPA: heme-binding domain-containing protein [Methylomirabilota bacterium]|nr:heme-binding domain-containing protein [Methylomirabilota bacterium]
MVKRAVVTLFLVGVVGLIGMQFVPYGRDHTNPPVVSEPAWDSPATRATAVKACFDCHSNQTVWPWYSNIAPASWLVQHDVDEGRSHLNFSTWKPGDGEEASEMVSSGRMPPFQYRLAHPEANLSDAEKAAFIKGLIATLGGEAGGEAD